MNYIVYHWQLVLYRPIIQTNNEIKDIKSHDNPNRMESDHNLELLLVARLDQLGDSGMVMGFSDP